MIYFFNNDLELKKIVHSENVIATNHEHELNNLTIFDVSMDLSYAKQFIDDVDHMGYYYRNEFYLHKINSVEENHADESVNVHGRHKFFDDMLFGQLIMDFRPENRDALFILRQAIDNHTDWQTVMTDTTGTLSTNFYRQVPYEALEWVMENFRLEFKPVILFDGQNINVLQLQVAKQIGEDKNIRVPFGDRVENMEYDIDYSEIVTKMAVHGKGEEVGDGYGRRINISTVNFNRNGVVSPTGNIYMEDPDITNMYGNDGGKPRHSNEIFEDIENVNELAEAGYERYLELSRPQIILGAEVAQIGDVGIGDSVVAIRREHNLYIRARVHKLKVDLLNPEDAEVVLGDYTHFKETKVERRTRERNNQRERRNNSRITELKNEFDRRFDGEVAQFKADFEQALIDAHAEIQAAEVRMTDLIETTRNDWTDAFNQEVSDIYDEAQRNYGLIRDDITSTVSSTREEMEMEFSNQVESTREYAEQQATDRAESVRADLESVTDSHQGLLDNLRSDVTSIDDFIGDRNVSLGELFQQERMDFEERINNIDTWHYNLLRGTRLDEPEKVSVYNGNIVSWSEILQFRGGTSSEVSQSYLNFLESITLEANKEYTLSFDYKSEFVPETDNIWLISDDGTPNFNITHTDNRLETNIFNLKTDGYWQRAYIKFKPSRNLRGTLRVGTHFSLSNTQTGTFDIRLVYLTDTGRTKWLFHQLDNTQNLEEITRRVTQLEDGYEEFITRTEYDYITEDIQGTVRQIKETVDESSSLIADHENWITNNATLVEQTSEAITDKVWLTDMHNPNILPHSDVSVRENQLNWDRGLTSVTGQSYQNWMQVTHVTSPRTYLGVYSPYFETVAGETYTVSFESWENGNDSQNTSGIMDYVFITYGDAPNISIWGRNERESIGTINGATIYKNRMTFTANNTSKQGRLLIGTRVISLGERSTFRFRKPKLELGDRATPYRNAYSSLERRADEIALNVTELDGEVVKHAQINVSGGNVRIGAQEIINDEQIASIINVGSESIDVITNRMILNGDLLVEGDVTALAVDAIEGEFARLWADEFEATTITGEHIESNTIEIKHLTGYDAILETLMARTVFSNNVTTLSIDAIDGRFGSLFAEQLETTVLESKHIGTSTITVQKLSGADAMLEWLMARTIFSNEVNTISLNAIYADLRKVDSEIMDTNILKANWIQGGQALFDKVFINNAMVERLTSKSVFARDVRAISIDAFELNLTTMMNKMGDVEGGLSITRPDGAVMVQNGIERFGHPVLLETYMDDGVSFTGKVYETRNNGSSIVKIASGDHAGRYYNLVVGLGSRYSNSWSSIEIAVVIRVQNRPSGTSWGSFHEERFTIPTGSMQYKTISYPLGRPTYGAMQFSIEYYVVRGNAGDNDVAQIRFGRSWVSA